MNACPSPLFAKPQPAWQRWVSIWHIVYYASLAIATAIASLTSAAAGKVPVMVGLSALLAAGTG